MHACTGRRPTERASDRTPGTGQARSRRRQPQRQQRGATSPSRKRSEIDYERRVAAAAAAAAALSRSRRRRIGALVCATPLAVQPARAISTDATARASDSWLTVRLRVCSFVCARVALQTKPFAVRGAIPLVVGGGRRERAAGWYTERPLAGGLAFVQLRLGPAARRRIRRRTIRATGGRVGIERERSSRRRGRG